jgi:hypothetical protein
MAARLATRAEIVGVLGTPGGVAPELNAATDAQVTVWSNVAAHLCNPARWRSLTSDAHALLTAHYLATAPGLGLGAGGGDLEEFLGVTTAIADGPASRSFGPVVSGEALSGTDALLATTAYGRAFLQLRRAQQGFGAFVVGSPGARARWPA